MPAWAPLAGLGSPTSESGRPGRPVGHTQALAGYGG